MKFYIFYSGSLAYTGVNRGLTLGQLTYSGRTGYPLAKFYPELWICRYLDTLTNLGIFFWNVESTLRSQGQVLLVLPGLSTHYYYKLTRARSPWWHIFSGFANFIDYTGHCELNFDLIFTLMEVTVDLWVIRVLETMWSDPSTSGSIFLGMVYPIWPEKRTAYCLKGWLCGWLKNSAFEQGDHVSKSSLVWSDKDASPLVNIPLASGKDTGQ